MKASQDQPLAPWLALGVREIVQEPTMIAALKQLYERHSSDLAKLKKKTYEQYAQECAQVAELTVDPGRREAYSQSGAGVDRGAAEVQAQTR